MSGVYLYSLPVLYGVERLNFTLLLQKSGKIVAQTVYCGKAR